MDELLAARLQMASSMVFHIVFAAIGMVMPFLMMISHYKYLKSGNELYLQLTKTWQKGVAIFFVVGAVSGTMLSFELGLLWPEFMKHAGPIIGMPFSLEGTAFFVEAIALGFYLYGWKNIKSKWFHWWTGAIVGISGLASGILVVAANGWMNAPSGFDYKDGVFSNIDPVAALFNDAWFSQALHMSLAAFIAVGFAVGGLHLWQYYRKKNSEIHFKAFTIALSIGAIGAILMPISGDIAAKDVAVRQPAKLAAMEALYETEKGADLLIGGIVDEETQEVSMALHIPNGLSFLAFNDFDAEVKGLNEFPKDEHPPVALTHYSFQVMVGIGGFLALLGVIFLISIKKQNWRKKKWFLYAFLIATPLGFIALEAGWFVTELGRQPWIINGIMKTKDAVTPVQGIQYSFYLYMLIYIGLSFTVYWLMNRQIKKLNSL
ncbi:cytochrome bd-I ubiquinol oxidase subunit 1 apoprotein [Lishizhenia tianjinensis]|uniref:Cytochrome bd-I ubiquinol oxidase subunit 1 apoprotein n=1 Tax=Lishizhenia tianjinensis TaxID=477690 RepID=A0A1I7AM95_9FLAO|nr:cytochrome ubiquinol oxidase subunit I [Lishizhenia tianjinensis]SFT75983.1 cytochrome bd-I ubiquinol oxidase subunit 1 apoprotein [Lishizhenia tianjinensis]